MKKVINTLHLIAALIPLLFVMSLLSLFVIEGARKGYWPNTIIEEAPASFFRSVIIFFYFQGIYLLLCAFSLHQFDIFFGKAIGPLDGC